MKPTKEGYIHYKEVGDQYVGRVINSFNVNSPDFGVSPPYFEFPGAVDN